jgi:hypothetical protein
MQGLRLTVGIPTQGTRPELLDKAIGSALAQAVPVRVLISNQGAAEAATAVCARYEGHPFVRMVESPAACLWENWCWAAESCDTELFAWLQDDDVLSPQFSRRVINCFDSCPKAQVYLARLCIALAGELAHWWQATGPMVPMDLLRGTPGTMNEAIMTAGAFFASHALSPGVAFRWSPEACRCVRNVPMDADLFAERLVLAELSKIGPAVCDPAIVGYWVHHDDNESTKQNAKKDGDRQYRVMLKHLAPILAKIPNWEDALKGWAYLVGHQTSKQFLKHGSPFRGESAELDRAIAAIEFVYPSLVEKAVDAPVEPRIAATTAPKPSKPRRAERVHARA